MDEKCDGAFLEEVENRWEFEKTIDACEAIPRLIRMAKAKPLHQKIRELKKALRGLMWLEEGLPEFDDDGNENPFDVARKALGE
jgi:hypothetical protein